MRNEQTNTAPPEVGAASSGSAGALESAWPRARAAVQGDFALALERDGSETAVLVLAGELDLYRAPTIEDALAQAIGREPDDDRRTPASTRHSSDRGQVRGEEVRRLTVDLCAVTFIDSTMLTLLLAASRRQQARGAELRVLVGPQTPMTAFKVTGIDRLLAISRDHDGVNGSAARPT